MANQENEKHAADFDHLYARITALEKRIIILESELDVKVSSDSFYNNASDDLDSSPEANKISDNESKLESKIGGYGLALLGNIVLLFGITFLCQYIHNSGNTFYAAVFGYISTIGILALAFFTKKKVAHLSSMFNIVGQFLLYYVTLRLHFFISNPLINNKYLAIILIFAVVFYQLIEAYRKKSELFASISIILMLTTGIISNYTPVTLSLSPFIAAGSVYLFYKFGWKRILILSLFLVYINFIIWYFVTPVIPQTIAFHNYCHYYLMACAAIFSLLCLITKKEIMTKNFFLVTLILNGVFFSAILATFVTSYLKENYTELFLIISGYCILYSILLKTRSQWKITPAFYAMYGFVAISVSFYGIFKLPYTFLFLALQSLFVLIIALWYRSKIIVTMNTFLFLMLLLSYLTVSGSVDIINFTIAGVAVANARILHWKTKLLDIKTDWFRNIYLFITFGMVLFALYKALPSQYITLSWTIAAILYFIFSILIHNIKYRWMAISTMLAAALYLFIVDLSRISMAYRIIAFLFLAIISIGISLYYTKIKKSTDSDEENTDSEKK